MKRSIIFFSLVLASSSFAQQFKLDSSFGDNGFVTAMSRSTIQKMVSLPDGKILCLGEYIDSLSNFRPSLFMFDCNGKLDSTFSDDGVLQDTIVKILDIPYPDPPFNFMSVQQDGRIYKAGSTPRGSFFNTIISCYDPNGNPIMSFGKNGVLILDTIENLHSPFLVGFSTFSTNEIIACWMGYYNNVYSYILSKFDSTGRIDRSFGTEGFLIFRYSTTNVDAITVLKDGSIICAGSDKSSINRKTTLIKLYSDGTFNQNFGIDGKVIIDVDTCEHFDIYGFPYLETARNVVELEDHRLILSSITDRRNRDYILCLLPDGSLDETFNFNGISEGFTRINDVVVLKDGSIIVCNDFGYTHLTPNGMVHSALNQQLPYSIYCVTSQGGGNLLCGGYTMLSSTDPNKYFSLARLNLDTSAQVTEIRIQTKKVSISPVPFRDVITFRSDQSVIRKITLYDLNGKCVLSRSVNDKSCTLKTDLAKGMYLCKIETSANIEFHKVISINSLK